jgi:hypothetical protein
LGVIDNYLFALQLPAKDTQCAAQRTHRRRLHHRRRRAVLSRRLHGRRIEGDRLRCALRVLGRQLQREQVVVDHAHHARQVVARREAVPAAEITHHAG